MGFVHPNQRVSREGALMKHSQILGTTHSACEHAEQHNSSGPEIDPERVGKATNDFWRHKQCSPTPVVRDKGQVAGVAIGGGRADLVALSKRPEWLVNALRQRGNFSEVLYKSDVSNDKMSSDVDEKVGGFDVAVYHPPLVEFLKANYLKKGVRGRHHVYGRLTSSTI